MRLRCLYDGVFGLNLSRVDVYLFFINEIWQWRLHVAQMPWCSRCALRDLRLTPAGLAHPLF